MNGASSSSWKFLDGGGDDDRHGAFSLMICWLARLAAKLNRRRSPKKGCLWREKCGCDPFFENTSERCTNKIERASL